MKKREVTRFRETIALVYKDGRTGRTLRIVAPGPNIVTDQGDRYYAQRGAVESPTYTFNLGQMIVAKSMSVTGSAKKTATFGRFILTTYTGRQNFESGYPKTNDSDTDNPGRTIDAVSWKRIYTTSQANYTIGAIGICRSGATTNSSGQLLSARTLATADKVVKTSSIVLNAYVNHTFLGT